MKKNFFKVMLLGAFTMTLGLVGCNDYGDDIDKLCKRIDDIDLSIEQIKAELAALPGEYVKSVEPNSDGDYVVQYADFKTGKDGRQVIIGRGTKMEVSADGYWVMDGVKTGYHVDGKQPANIPYPEIGADGYWYFPVQQEDGTWKLEKSNYHSDGKPGAVIPDPEVKNGNWWFPSYNEATGEYELKDSGIAASGDGTVTQDLAPYINGDGYWTFATFDEEGNYTEHEVSDIPARGSYIVENGGKFTLHIQKQVTDPATGKVTYAWTAITLNGASNALDPLADVTRIEILGWVTKYGNAIADGSLARVSVNEVQGELPSQDEPFIVNYSLVPDFTYDYDNSGDYNDTDNANTPDAPADFLHETPVAKTNVPVTTVNGVKVWKSGVAGKEVKQGSVTNTLAADEQGILIQVFPANADLSTVEFAIQNTHVNAEGVADGQVPIGFGTPIPVKAMLTRAISNNALWFIPGANYTGSKTYSGEDARADYLNEFKWQALYHLTANDKIVSDLTDFTIQSRMMASVEAPVLSVQEAVEDGAEFEVDGGEFNVIVSSALDSDKNLIEKWYKINFNEDVVDETDYPGSVDRPDLEAAAQYGEEGITDAVEDYYLETLSALVDPTLWEISFRNNNTEFMVKQLSDNLTLTGFDMNVYKLGVDGKVYLEKITIHPIRQDVVTTINLGTYTIVDENNDGIAPYMSTPLTVSLTDAYASNRNNNGADADVTAWPVPATAAGTPESMFTELGRYMWSANLTYEQFWKDVDKNGNPSISGRGASSWAIVDAYYYESGSDVKVPVPHTSTDPLAVAGLNFVGYDAAGEVTTVLEDVRSFKILMPYAIDGPAAAWVPNAQYTAVIDIADASGNKINTVKVLFTPVVPDPSQLWTPNPAYWTPEPTADNHSSIVLQAYYKEPLRPWAAGYAPTAQNGATPAASTSDVVTSYDIAVGNYTGATSVGAGGDGGFLGFSSGITWSIASIDAALPTLNPALTLTDYVTYAQDGATGTGVDLIFNLKQQYITVNEVTDNIDYNGNGVATDTSVVVPYDIVKILYEAKNGAGETSTQLPKYNAYGQTITMAPNADYKYLGVYNYDSEKLAAGGFKVKIMSALYEGKLYTKTGGITIQAAGGVQKVDKNDIWGSKYNNYLVVEGQETKYNVFKTWGANIVPVQGANSVYEYTYIDKVEFIVPDGVNNVGKLNYTNDYSIVDIDGVDTKVGSEATADADGCIYIEPKNTTNAVAAKIIVRVYDRFGKVKEEMLDLNIVKANPIP